MGERRTNGKRTAKATTTSRGRRERIRPADEWALSQGPGWDHTFHDAYVPLPKEARR